MMTAERALPIPNVLLFTGASEAALFQDLLREHASVAVATTLAELRRLLRAGHHDALLCSRKFRAVAWSHVLEDRRGMTPRSQSS